MSSNLNEKKCHKPGFIFHDDRNLNLRYIKIFQICYFWLIRDSDVMFCITGSPERWWVLHEQKYPFVITRNKRLFYECGNIICIHIICDIYVYIFSIYVNISLYLYLKIFMYIFVQCIFNIYVIYTIGKI